MRTTNASSAGRLLRILHRLHNMGYRNLRFYAYTRWVGSLAIFIYQEMPYRTREGAALICPYLCAIEVGKDLRPTENWGAIDWLDDGASERECAEHFVRRFLAAPPEASGAFDAEYTEWLTGALEKCPEALFPITEEPFPASDWPRITMEFFPRQLARDISPDGLKDYPLPPGLRGAIDPYKAFRDEMERRTRK